MEVGPFNLLFLPLLGGFVFYTRWNLLAFYSERSSGHRLLFSSATAGLLFLVVARLTVVANRALVIPNQATFVNWTQYLLLGSMIVVEVGLLAVFTDAKSDARLDHEFREAPYKAALGVLLSIILAIFFTIAFCFMYDVHALSVEAGLFALGIVAASTTATRMLRGFLRGLRLPHRASGLFLRVSLVILLTAEMLFLWAILADHLSEYWKLIVPLQNSGTPFIACAIGLLLWCPLNLLVRSDAAAALLHRDHKTGSLERFLYFAEIDKTLVQLSLRDGKVYVGWIQHLPPHPGSPDSFLNILPVRSGFRDPRTRKVRFTTDYATYYAAHTTNNSSQNEGPTFEVAAFTKLVPIANIDSASRFDPAIFELFSALEKQKGGSTQNATSTSSSDTAPTQVSLCSTAIYNPHSSPTYLRRILRRSRALLRLRRRRRRRNY